MHDFKIYMYDIQDTLLKMTMYVTWFALFSLTSS